MTVVVVVYRTACSFGTGLGCNGFSAAVAELTNHCSVACYSQNLLKLWVCTVAVRFLLISTLTLIIGRNPFRNAKP